MNDTATFRANSKSGSLKQWLLLNVLLLCIVGALNLTYPVEELSRRVADIYFRLRGNRDTSTEVGLILIDDASLQQYGRWPWKRSLLAQVVRAANAERPKALGLDILLAEEEDEINDSDLERAISDAGNAVLVAKVGDSPEGHLWVEPLPRFAHGAAGVGHAQAALGPDSICRSVPLTEPSLDGAIWPFALEVARVTQGAALKDEGHRVRLGDQEIPIIGKPSQVVGTGIESATPRFLLIDYRGEVAPSEGPPPFSAISVKDLLQGKSQGQLHGKAVLIGFGSTEIDDRLPTPVSTKLPMAGVEIHANLLDAILGGRCLHPLNLWLDVVCLCTFSLASTWVVLRWPVWHGLAALIAFLAMALLAGYLAFAWRHILVSLGPFFCVGVLSGPIGQIQNLLLVDRNLTRRLRQLQSFLQGAEPGQEESLTAALHPQVEPGAGDLHWKVALLGRLQADLGSLYAFNQTLLEAMQEGLAVFSCDGRILFRNPQWQIFCERQGWLTAHSYEELTRALQQLDWNALTSPGIGLDADVHLGEGLWQLRAVKLKPENSVSTSDVIMVVVSDQTARLERDRARAEALAFVTHELRTPLVSIQGFAEYLLRYSKEPGKNEAAATIFQESGRLVGVINTYLDVLRLDAGARPARNQIIEVAEIIQQVQRVVQPIADVSAIKVHAEVAEDLPLLQGDRHLLEGAMLNLLGNAIKYSARGSEVKLGAKVEDGGIVLEVWNPGPAIPAEELGRLFEPFYRRSEQERTQPGWGLGLAFVKKIAEQHGGKAEAWSMPGDGTSFRIHLPTSRLIGHEANS